MIKARCSMMYANTPKSCTDAPQCYINATNCPIDIPPCFIDAAQNFTNI